MPSFLAKQQSPNATTHLALSISALLLGLSRVLLPLLFLKDSLVDGFPWLAPLGHLAHHGSAILGTFVGPRLLAKSKFLVPIAASPDDQNSAEKLNKLLLFLCTGLKAFGFGLLATAYCPLILAAVLAVGIADGVIQRLLLAKALQLKQGDNQSGIGLAHFLLQISAGPLLSALILIGQSDGNELSDFPVLIRQMPIQFSVQPTAMFIALALAQAILLIPFWPTNWGQYEEDLETAENSPSYAQSVLGEAKNAPNAFRLPLMAPLCLLAILTSALADSLLYTFFGFMSTRDETEFEALHMDFLLFAAFGMLARLLLALLPAQHQQNNIASPNVLFPVGLFGAGVALCALSAPQLRSPALAIYGFALHLLWPAILLHLRHSVSGSHVGDVDADVALQWLLVAAQIGPLVFPMLLTKVFDLYGGPQLLSSLALLAILLMVVAFVSLLNTQAQQPGVPASKRGQFWGWFRGEGGRRTRRSIRRFVRNVRGSLRRPKATNRCQKRRRMGTAELALLDERSSHGNYNSILQELNHRAGSTASSRILPRRLPSATPDIGMQHKEAANVHLPQSRSGTPLALRRGQFSLPSIVVHQGTPTQCQSANRSMQSLDGEGGGD